MTNTIQSFLLNDLNIRGVLVHIDSAWQEVLARRSYPAAITTILGEASVANLLMSSHIKFNGKLTLQLQSDGDLRLLVVQSDNQHRFRALARYQEPMPSGGGLRAMAQNGVIIISIEAEVGDQPYQGLISLDSDSIAENIETYFNQSEQLQTVLILRADAERAAGLLLQAMPDGSAGTDDWQRLRYVGETLSLAECDNTDSQTMIKRLFAEDDVITYPERNIQFVCSCSDERTFGMLTALSNDELQEIIDKAEDVVIDCDFCGKRYRHDVATIAALLANKMNPN